MDEGNKNGNGNEAFLPYPKPLAKYDDVIADRSLFMQTLEKLHATMKTKFMIPIIGGKDLDLHRLFKEVTSRGGIEKVISDRRWKEVTATFSFPSTATNASFILRKYYISLLRHYEQIYFFGLQGWNATLNDNLTSAATTSVPSRRLAEPMASTSESPAQKRKLNKDPPVPVFPSVVGVIDGKFEHGYFVTVTVGSEKLKGVLYHCPDQAPAMHPPPCTRPADIITGIVAGVSNTRGGGGGRRRRRRRRLSKLDPDHPKPNRSGYNFFFKEQHARLKPLHPGKDREISRMIGDLWNNLTESEKDVYQERGRADKERYKSELAIYKERQKTEQVLSNVVPIQQRPASGPDSTVEGVDAKVQKGDVVLSNDDNENNSSSEGTQEEYEGKKLYDSASEGSLNATPVDASQVAGPSTKAEGFELKRRASLESETTKDGQNLEGNNSVESECEMKMPGN